MLVRKHLIYGFIFSILLFLFFPIKVGLIGFFIIFASSVLIDTDHFIYYIVKDKSWSLKKSIKHFKEARKKRSKMPLEKRKEYYSGWCFLHGIEFLIILFLLGFFIHKYFYFILFGVLFHLILDFIEQVMNKQRIDKLSSVYDYFKFKKLKRL